MMQLLLSECFSELVSKPHETIPGAGIEVGGGRRGYGGINGDGKNTINLKNLIFLIYASFGPKQVYLP